MRWVCAQRQMPGDMAVPGQGRAGQREKLDEEVRQGKARQGAQVRTAQPWWRRKGQVESQTQQQYVQCGAVSVAQDGSIVGGDWGQSNRIGRVEETRIGIGCEGSWAGRSAARRMEDSVAQSRMLMLEQWVTGSRDWEGVRFAVAKTVVVRVA